MTAKIGTAAPGNDSQIDIWSRSVVLHLLRSSLLHMIAAEQHAESLKVQREKEFNRSIANLLDLITNLNTPFIDRESPRTQSDMDHIADLYSIQSDFTKAIGHIRKDNREKADAR